MKEKRVEKHKKHKNIIRIWGKAVCSLLLGLAGEACLDHCFSFLHGREYFPALIMLWICLSILSAALIEGAEILCIKANRIVQPYKIMLEAEEISFRLSSENGCSFPENACILGNECRDIPEAADGREKAHRTVIAFSHTKSYIRAGRRLRNAG